MQQKPNRRPGETLFALAIVVFSATAFWQAYGISGFSGLTTAGTFPMLASLAMLTSSLVILASTLRGERSAVARHHVGEAQPVTSILPRPVMVVTGLVLGYVLLIPLFGFMLSSGAFLFTAFWYLWQRGMLVSLLLALVSLAAIYAVFRLVFQVVLPAGSLVRGVF